jgi:hypothetical protein
MKKLLVLVTVTAAIAAATGTGRADAQVRFPRGTFTMDAFTTQVQNQTITWIGPDGTPYTVDRYYEYEATLSWTGFPPHSSMRLEISDPSKDQNATIEVSGHSSYVFTGTAENGWWAFPGDSISFRLIVCLNRACATYELSGQIPN